MTGSKAAPLDVRLRWVSSNAYNDEAAGRFVVEQSKPNVHLLVKGLGEGEAKVDFLPL